MVPRTGTRPRVLFAHVEPVADGDQADPDDGAYIPLTEQDPSRWRRWLRWQFWDAAHFAPPLGTLVFEKIVKPMAGMGEPDPHKIEEAITSSGALPLSRRSSGRKALRRGRRSNDCRSDDRVFPHVRDADGRALAELRNAHSWFARITGMDASLSPLSRSSLSSPCPAVRRP